MRKSKMVVGGGQSNGAGSEFICWRRRWTLHGRQLWRSLTVTSGTFGGGAIPCLVSDRCCCCYCFCFFITFAFADSCCVFLLRPLPSGSVALPCVIINNDDGGRGGAAAFVVWRWVRSISVLLSG